MLNTDEITGIDKALRQMAARIALLSGFSREELRRRVAQLEQLARQQCPAVPRTKPARLLAAKFSPTYKVPAHGDKRDEVRVGDRREKGALLSEKSDVFRDITRFALALDVAPKDKISEAMRYGTVWPIRGSKVKDAKTAGRVCFMWSAKVRVMSQRRLDQAPPALQSKRATLKEAKALVTDAVRSARFFPLFIATLRARIGAHAGKQSSWPSRWLVPMGGSDALDFWTDSTLPKHPAIRADVAHQIRCFFQGPVALATWHRGRWVVISPGQAVVFELPGE